MNIFERAIDRLERQGWVQGELGRPDGSACLVGALYFESDIELEVYGRGIQAVKNVLGFDPCDQACADVVSWNDAPGRTADEVVECLRLASKELVK